MKEANVIEGNKLIAEFVGAKYVKRDDGFTDDFGYKFKQDPSQSKFNRSGWWKWDCLEYHTSWDWLMPVVEKIGLIQYSQPGKNYYETIKLKLSLINLEAVWKAVINFIKWYNTQK